MISLLRPTELVCLILHIKAKDEQQFDSLPNNYRSFFEGKSFSFPIVSNSELKAIQKMSKEESKNNLQLPEIIRGMTSFKTIYDSKIIAGLCPGGALLTKSPDYSAAILLHLFLAFFKDRNCDQNYLALFNAFIAIINYSKPLKYLQKSKSIAVSSFIYLFDYIFSKNLVTKLEEYSNLFVPLVQLLSTSDELPIESFELLLKLTNHLIKPTDNKLSDVSTSFLNFVIAIMRSCGNRFPSQIASRMISLLRMALVGLDNSALLFFSRCVNNISVEEAMTIILAFPDALVTSIESSSKAEKKKSIDPIDIQGEELPVLPQKATQVFFSPTYNSLLPSDILSQPKPNVPGTQIIFSTGDKDKIGTFYQFVSKEIESKCSYISKIVEGSNDMRISLASLVFNKITNINSQPHSPQLLPTLITLLIYLSPIPSDIITGLFNLSFIYDQRVTFLTNPLPSYYEYIATIRSCLSVLLMKQEPKIIEEVYEIMRTKPYLFQDFACRIVPHFLPRHILKHSFEAVAISVASASFYYKNLTSKGESNDQKDIDPSLTKILINNRICCFQILGEIFDIPKYMCALCASSQFVPSLIGFLFEEPTRQFCLRYLNQYFQTKESENNTDLITDFIKIITTAMKDSYTPFSFRFLIDLTKFLDVTISNNSDLSKPFEPVIPTICEWIVNMPKCNDGITVLIQTISMFSAFFSTHKMTQSEVSAIDTAAKNMYGSSSSSKELEKQLILLIFAQSKSDVDYKENEYFGKFSLIKQPKALKLLLTLFYNKETIEFLINLCKFSPINSYICRSVQLDVFVLEKLFNLRTTDNVNTFELLLKLFSEIGKVNSAVSVVNQFISLFSTINGKFISRYHLMLLSALEILCENSKLNPVSILIKATSTISKVPSESVKKGFVVTFWMLNHSKETSNKLVDIGTIASFEISNNKIGISYNKSNSNNEIINKNADNDDDDEDEDDNDANIDDNENVVANYSSSFEYNKKFSTSIPLYQWVHVSLSFKIKDNKTYCFLALNGVFQEYMRIKTPIIITEKTTDFTFYSSSKLYIGPYGIYPYFRLRKMIEKDGKKVNDPNPLFTVDCRSKPKFLVKPKTSSSSKSSSTFKPIAYITPHSYNSTMKLEVESTIPDIDVKVFVGKSYDIITFVDALTERCGVSVLLPLFAQVDLKIFEKQEQMKYIDILIEVIRNLFSVNPSISQLDFLNDKGFEILEHLLKECHYENINDKLYTNLIRLYESLTNNELKHQFLTQVLTNMEIWIHCDIDSIKTAIICLTQLFDKKQKEMKEAITKKELCFTNLLTTIRRYFYYKKKEESICFTGTRFRIADEIPKETISELRNLLLNLFRKFVDIFGINDNNFIFLLAQIFTAPEEEQRDDLTPLMIEIANNNLIKNDESLLLMTYLINTAKYAPSVMNVFAITTTKKEDHLSLQEQQQQQQALQSSAEISPLPTPTEKSKSKHKDKKKDKDKDKEKKKDKKKDKDKKDKKKDKGSNAEEVDDSQLKENENDSQQQTNLEPKPFLTPNFLKTLVQVVIRTITPEFLADTNNTECLKKMVINPAFFPIITYCGLNNGKLNELMNAFTEINNKPLLERQLQQPLDLGDIYDYDFWYFWLVASLYIGNESQIQFLIRSPSKYWVQIYLAIDFVGRIILEMKNHGKIHLDNIKQDFEEKTIRDMKRNFIIQLWASSQVSTKEKASDFLYLCKLYLFYQVESPIDKLHITLQQLKQQTPLKLATPEPLTASSRRRPAPHIPSPMNRKTENLKIITNPKMMEKVDDADNKDDEATAESNIPLSPLGPFGSRSSMAYLLERSPAVSPVQSPKPPSKRQILSPLVRSKQNIPKLEGRKTTKFSPSALKRNSMSRRSVTMKSSITLLNPSEMAKSSQQLLLQLSIDDNAPSILSKPPDFNFMMILANNQTTKMNQWVDMVVVENALKIWAKFHDTYYDDTALLILSFLPPNKREDYLKLIDFQSIIQKWKDYKTKLSQNQQQNPISQEDDFDYDNDNDKTKKQYEVGDPYLNDILNNHKIEAANTPFFSSLGIYNAMLKMYQPKEATIGGMTEDDFIPMVHFYIQSLNNDMNTEYKKFIDNYTQKSIGEGFNEYKKIKGIADTEISQLIGSVNQVFITDINSNKVSSAKAWNHLWRQMTIENAPWYHSLPPEHRKQEHFKRDMTGCFCFCPFQERRNFEFNDHIKDSLTRDTGNQCEANEIYNKFIEERKQKYSRSQPPEIFNVIDEAEDDHEDIYSSLSGSFCSFPCEFVTISKTEEAIFYIREEDIVINNKSITKIIPFAMIRFIFKRTYLQQSTAIEIFLRNGDSFFVNFPDIKAMAVLKEIEKYAIDKKKHIMTGLTIQFIQNKRFQPFFSSFKLTEAWAGGLISNFEYLMMLNIYSGRSFNNASQYPIMPWILTDYDSPEIHLDDEKVYRDLSKPIGALNPERLEDYISDYKSYESEGMPAFMYSSAPISPLSLFLYLVRQEPFTTLHIEMQGERFDNAARLFVSIKKTFETVTTLKGDFRELIPEFFFLPDFLQNKNHFDLGKINPNEGLAESSSDAPSVPVNDVELPPWATSPIDFIYKHRKALESKYVSSHLHEWIDLIWGVKQNSFEARNVYKPQMYKGIWKTEMGRDIINRPEIEAILMYVGQMPARLFSEPHPPRTVFPRNGIENDQNSVTSIFATLNTTVNMNIDFNVRILGGYLSENMLITIDDKGDFILAEINFDEVLKQAAGNSKSQGFGFKKRLNSVINSSLIGDKQNKNNSRGIPILNIQNVQYVPSSNSAKSRETKSNIQNFLGVNLLSSEIPNNSSENPEAKFSFNSKIKAFSLSDEDHDHDSSSSSSFLADEISYSPFFKSIIKTKMSIFSMLHQSHPPETSSSSSDNSNLTVTVTASAASLHTEEIELPEAQVHSSVALFLSPEMIVVGNAINDIFFISLNPVFNNKTNNKGGKAAEQKVSFISAILKLMESRNEVVAIAAERQYIAAADLDAFLTVYDTRMPTKPLFSIPSFRESIKCIAVSQIFHLVVCGARESSDTLSSSSTNVKDEEPKKASSLSSLLFCSINSRSFFKSVNLGEKIPNMVLLTICWGFTLVQTKHIEQGKRIFNLLLFTSNGEFIREVNLKSEFVKWNTFRSKSGFDFVVACDETLNVYAFEAFYFDIKEPIFKAKNKVVDMTYLEQEEAISILTENGNLIFVPFKC